MALLLATFGHNRHRSQEKLICGFSCIGNLQAILGSTTLLIRWSDFLFGLDYLYFMPSKICIHLSITALLSVAGEKAFKGGPKFAFGASRLFFLPHRETQSHLNWTQKLALKSKRILIFFWKSWLNHWQLNMQQDIPRSLSPPEVGKKKRQWTSTDKLMGFCFSFCFSFCLAVLFFYFCSRTDYWGV